MSEPVSIEKKEPTYFQKLKGKTFKADLPKVGFDQVIWSFIGGFIALSVVSFLGNEWDFFSLYAPFGASAVLLFGAPVAPFSQPRNVFGGHVIAALVGVTVHNLVGTSFYAIGLSVGLAIAIMVAVKAIHPPAGATAFIGVTGSAGSYMWVLTPIALGAAIMILVAVLVNNLDKKRHYPVYWL